MHSDHSGYSSPFIICTRQPSAARLRKAPGCAAVETSLSDFQEFRMLIQCLGFTVEPLGPLPLLFSEGLPYQVADWTKGNVFFSSRVTIEATGETQILQVFPVGGQTQVRPI